MTLGQSKEKCGVESYGWVAMRIEIRLLIEIHLVDHFQYEEYANHQRYNATVDGLRIRSWSDGKRG